MCPVCCACRKQLQKLKDEGDPLRYRADEVGAREQARADALKFVTGARESIASWARTKPWINETDCSAMLKQARPQPLRTWSLFGAWPT